MASGRQTIAAPDPDTLAWAYPVDGSFATGDLATVATYAAGDSGGFTAATSLDISNDDPAPGTGSWDLMKSVGGGGTACNEVSTWTSGGPGELPGRDTALP